MHSVREIAKDLVAELGLNHLECDPDAGRNFKKIAVQDYATFLKKSPCRSLATNECALQTAYIYAERAIKAGIPEEQIEKYFFLLRAYWIPRLRLTHGN